MNAQQGTPLSPADGDALTAAEESVSATLGSAFARAWEWATWPIDNKIPIGREVRDGVRWVTTNLREGFDAFSETLGDAIDTIVEQLQQPDPWVLAVVAALLIGGLARSLAVTILAAAGLIALLVAMPLAAERFGTEWLAAPAEAIAAYPALVLIAAITALAYVMRRSLGITLFTLFGLLLILNQGYWEETTETLALVISATLVCMAIGIPLGIAAARREWVYTALRPILDLMQTVPTFVYLIPALILFGLGMVPGLVATVIFALPAPIRLTRLGIASTPPALKEAAVAFGASSWQRLLKVELPYARPQILAGLTQCIMLSLSMVVIAALVAADGLGVPTLRALNTNNIAMGFEAGLAIVILAIVLDRLFKAEPAS